MDLEKAQHDIQNRILTEVPIMVNMLTDNKSPTIEQIWDNARVYGESLIAETTKAYPDYAHNLCKNAMADADMMLNARGPLIASYSAALWAILRYRPER